MEIKPRFLGIIPDPPTLVLSYDEISTNGGRRKRRKRKMPLRNFTDKSNVSRVDFTMRQRHDKYLAAVLPVTVYKMLRIIQEIMKGLDTEDAIKQVNKEYEINPEENLNKLSNAELAQKKLIMDEEFRKNLLEPGHPDFAYDKVEEFDKNCQKPSEWDIDEDDEDEAGQSQNQQLNNNTNDKEKTILDVEIMPLPKLTPKTYRLPPLLGLPEIKHKKDVVLTDKKNNDDDKHDEFPFKAEENLNLGMQKDLLLDHDMHQLDAQKDKQSISNESYDKMSYGDNHNHQNSKVEDNFLIQPSQDEHLEGNLTSFDNQKGKDKPSVKDISTSINNQVDQDKEDSLYDKYLDDFLQLASNSEESDNNDDDDDDEDVILSFNKPLNNVKSFGNREKYNFDDSNHESIPEQNVQYNNKPSESDDRKPAADKELDTFFNICQVEAIPTEKNVEKNQEESLDKINNPNESGLLDTDIEYIDDADEDIMIDEEVDIGQHVRIGAIENFHDKSQQSESEDAGVDDLEDALLEMDLSNILVFDKQNEDFMDRVEKKTTDESKTIAIEMNKESRPLLPKLTLGQGDMDHKDVFLNSVVPPEDPVIKEDENEHQMSTFSLSLEKSLIHHTGESEPEAEATGNVLEDSDKQIEEPFTEKNRDTDHDAKEQKLLESVEKILLHSSSSDQSVDKVKDDDKLTTAVDVPLSASTSEEGILQVKKFSFDKLRTAMDVPLSTSTSEEGILQFKIETVSNINFDDEDEDDFWN